MLWYCVSVVLFLRVGSPGGVCALLCVWGLWYMCMCASPCAVSLPKASSLCVGSMDHMFCVCVCTHVRTCAVCFCVVLFQRPSPSPCVGLFHEFPDSPRWPRPGSQVGSQVPSGGPRIQGSTVNAVQGKVSDPRRELKFRGAKPGQHCPRAERCGAAGGRGNRGREGTRGAQRFWETGSPRPGSQPESPERESSQAPAQRWGRCSIASQARSRSTFLHPFTIPSAPDPQDDQPKPAQTPL